MRPAFVERNPAIATIELIAREGPMTRAQLAGAGGFAERDIAGAVHQMRAADWLRTAEGTGTEPEDAGTRWELVCHAAFIACVDLGGTSIRATVADLACGMREEVREETDSRGGFAVVRQVARLCREAAEAGGAAMDKVAVASIGSPGVADPATGRMRLTPNIDGLDAIDFRGEIAAALGVETILENDVNLAAVGESWLAPDRAAEDLVYVKFGTGIGAGILVGGELLRGAAGAAGHVGFLPFGSDPFDAESLRAGALERIAGSAGMRERYQVQTGKSFDVPAIFAAAAAGEAPALACLEETARCVARGLGAICAIVNPARIVLGGSIGCRKELFARVRELLPQCCSEPVELVPAERDEDTALVGAAVLGRRHLAGLKFPKPGE